MELPTAIAVVIAVISLLLNIAAVMISRSQVAAARSQTEVQRQIHRDSSQPYIWADIRLNPDDGATLDWVVGNSGPTVATDVTFRVDPPFGDIHPLTSAAIERMAKGMASLPPGRTNWWSLGATYDLVKSTGPQPRTITIDATGPFGPLPTLEYVITRGAQDAARRPAGEAVSDDGKGQDGCHRPGDAPREGVRPSGMMLAAKMAWSSSNSAAVLCTTPSARRALCNVGLVWCAVCAASRQ